MLQSVSDVLDVPQTSATTALVTKLQMDTHAKEVSARISRKHRETTMQQAQSDLKMIKQLVKQSTEIHESEQAAIEEYEQVTSAIGREQRQLLGALRRSLQVGATHTR